MRSSDLDNNNNHGEAVLASGTKTTDDIIKLVPSLHSSDLINSNNHIEDVSKEIISFTVSDVIVIF